MKKQVAFCMSTLALALACSPASSQEVFKVGLLTTLSGPGAAIGAEIRDGFELGLNHSGGKLGGVDVALTVLDDQQKPMEGRQAVDRLVKRDKVDVITGMAFSNVLLPVMPTILNSDTVYISANTGPADYAGERCHPNFFSVSWQNEDIPAAMGKYVTDQAHKKVYLIAPNYPGGRESIEGFKRLFKGEIADEVYVKVGQMDYAAELAQMRASGADAVFFFLPGGMGVSFIKQLINSGLSSQLAVYTPGFSADQDTIAAIGESMKGMANAAQWSPDLDNPVNKRFVADFEKTYGRLPSMYASQGYDAALLLDGALKADPKAATDREALRKALRSAPFESVRGAFAFNNNQYPVQTYYMREVAPNEKGQMSNKIVSTVFEQFQDHFAPQCKMEKS
ncbi:MULTISPECIES: ABC transporter substrate-binding protein [Alcaligenes]|jgi:branched-chain amino acid transport system substrate-binding protein|uniref:ABC transporter substrate-binding protein n=1 Tax=Alcaligenes faecalis TaxID=511 RepID=A0A2U2BGL5_ALCFA|nr:MULTISPECIES: ABC transporter substrate-binding protein [Alcaligenes]KAA1286677.1 ABC transporter substrate-binding protein [Alcaligenes faecalis]MBQ0217393.1 ABC transporter substrate-binding protein [Alcaligenes faecalis]MBW4789481.1 ABC transporter substrate-binding protein [Alcaligenes faecalis subsp. faecalis]MDT0217598.1 ABC transporter substrate-binding protein [Alcaligenes sp. AB3]PWE13155.1 ABC transporter substrate-binding protein [Alcaligenes faecalis]